MEEVEAAEAKMNAAKEVLLNHVKPHFLFEGRVGDRMIESTPVFMRL